MAGIGFELKKLFKKKGIFAAARAYGYAVVVSTGPMLLGVLLILGIFGVCSLMGIDTAERELLICMITYTLLASIVITSFFSMVATRYTSDMLFEDMHDRVMPSFWGSTVITMVVGGILYGVFLLFSGAEALQIAFLFMYFAELCIAWNGMGYLSAIKDYKGIFLSFLTAILVTMLLGALLLYIGVPTIESMLIALTTGYGIMDVWQIALLHKHFPESKGGAFEFLRWADRYPQLTFLNFFTNLGMIVHIVILWFSDIGTHLMGLFYSAPYYDVPALFALMTTFVTTVNFVVSLEVNFYPKYRDHIALYGDKGTSKDIVQAEKEMLSVLKTELFYTALKQLLCTALFIAIGGYLFDMLPLGFNETMRGYFRTLCVGYALYAIGNTFQLILLYFTDYKGALLSSTVFFVGSVGFTLLSLLFPSTFYGFGFLLAAFLFAIVAVFRLDYYTKRLPYYILGVQPLVAESQLGFFTKIGVLFDRKLSGKDPK